MPGDCTLPKLPPGKLSTAGVNLFLAVEFARIATGRLFTVEEARYGFAWMRMHYGGHLPRPRGTITGPSMFALVQPAGSAFGASRKRVRTSCGAGITRSISR
jgi:hypothetical protein